MARRRVLEWKPALSVDGVSICFVSALSPTLHTFRPVINLVFRSTSTLFHVFQIFFNRTSLSAARPMDKTRLGLGDREIFTKKAWKTLLPPSSFEN